MKKRRQIKQSTKIRIHTSVSASRAATAVNGRSILTLETLVI